MFELKAETRTAKTSAQSLRKTGKLPAVFYGRKEKATSIALDAIAFKKLWKEAGESTIVTLQTEHGELGAIIHDVQVDPVKDTPVHVDFYIVEKDKPIEVEVPLEFEGVAPAVKDLGGTLVKVLHNLEVSALPKNLPHSLTVDISALVDFDAHIAAKDISLPIGVTLVTKEDETVALVAAPREEKEEEAPAAIDMTAIEVEKRGKEEEGTPEGEAKEEGQ